MIHATRLITVAPALLALLVLAACKPAAKPAPTPPPGAHDHDHAEGEEHGEEVELGSQKAGTFDVTAVIGKSWAQADDAHVEVKITAGGKPNALRAWIGSADKLSNRPESLHDEGEHYHGHVTVPKPLAADAKLYVQVDADGKTETASFDISAAK